MSQHPAKQIIKNFLLRVLPGPAGNWQNARQRQYIHRFEQRMGLNQLTRSYIADHGLSVSSGPFAGMKCVPEAVCSALMPKLIGCYEAELHGVVSQILATDYTSVVDIGCAEGYYANGFAMRLPSALVHAFDVDPEARKLCATMAQLNDVQDRVIISGKCDSNRLNIVLTDRSLIVCDCEGCETELLRPDLVPAMAQADILVELHEHIKPGIVHLIQNRFRETHNITLIDVAERNPDDYRSLQFTDEASRRLSVSEFRSVDQQWAFLQALPSRLAGTMR